MLVIYYHLLKWCLGPRAVACFLATPFDDLMVQLVVLVYSFVRSLRAQLECFCEEELLQNSASAYGAAVTLPALSIDGSNNDEQWEYLEEDDYELVNEEEEAEEDKENQAECMVASMKNTVDAEAYGYVLVDAATRCDRDYKVSTGKAEDGQKSDNASNDVIDLADWVPMSHSSSIGLTGNKTALASHLLDRYLLLSDGLMS
jgi:hypothetical protein